MTNRLSVEDIERLLKTATLPLTHMLGEQLLDTLRENERLRDALKWLINSPTKAAFDSAKLILKRNKDSYNG